MVILGGNFFNPLRKELSDLNKNPPLNASAGPIDDNMYKWQGRLIGTGDSPYQGGVFNIDIEFSNDYPFKPPKVKFLTKIYHPNIDEDGSICMGLLKTDVWKPSTKIADVLLALSFLLEQPVPEDALNTTIAEEYRSNYAQFVKTAKEWVNRYCKDV
ncbi:hypothetical protein HK096_003304 [Nowakowskiella sp. JEL0078]|nr:hypothetical protein HK096_003304 [Nowakowskiella sp. JEL0078]